ncbi:MAG: F0F1 ATP synthase subunit B' [Rhodospirillales bacterium]|jgi:F-type H+-transporting ATPase subunit b|nr:F0F1 ATP synthase subunit B' [Rhodospirillales bacterium]
MPQIEQIWSFPSQIFWLAITFAALFLVIWKVAAPRISSVLEARQRRIEDNLDKAANFKREAEAAIEAYEAAIAESRVKAHELINEASHSVAAEAAASEAALAEKLQVRIAESEEAITKAKQEAIAGLRDVALDVASAVVEKLSGESPESANVNQAVDTALKARS